MGMYTAISLGVELNIERDCQVAEILSYMVNDGDRPRDLPDHEFFNCSRWHATLCCDSYYFDWQTHFSFEWDYCTSTYFLSGVSNMKNYSDEIKKFLDWLNPYIHRASCGFIGWMMYEEQCEPDLIMRRRLPGTKTPRIFYVRTEGHVEKHVANQVAKEEPIT